MKRRIALVSLIVIIIAIGALSTVAAFTAVDSATNVITTGSIDIALDEKMLTETGEEVEYIDGAIAMPNGTISKIVRVENTCDEPAYIRLKCDISFDNEELEVKYIALDYNSSDWEYNVSDGYYYYKHVLAPHQTSEIFMETVSIDAAMPNEYMNITVFVKIAAEAVQSRFNGDNYTAASGWPVSG